MRRDQNRHKENSLTQHWQNIMKLCFPSSWVPFRPHFLPKTFTIVHVCKNKICACSIEEEWRASHECVVTKPKESSQWVRKKRGRLLWWVSWVEKLMPPFEHSSVRSVSGLETIATRMLLHRQPSVTGSTRVWCSNTGRCAQSELQALDDCVSYVQESHQAYRQRCSSPPAGGTRLQGGERRLGATSVPERRPSLRTPDTQSQSVDETILSWETQSKELPSSITSSNLPCSQQGRGQLAFVLCLGCSEVTQQPPQHLFGSGCNFTRITYCTHGYGSWSKNTGRWLPQVQVFCEETAARRSCSKFSHVSLSGQAMVVTAS